MSAVIEIESLVLDGLDAVSARRTVRAFEVELGRLLDRDGLPPGLGAADLGRLDLGQLPAGPERPEDLGRAMARALFARLVR